MRQLLAAALVLVVCTGTAGAQTRNPEEATLIVHGQGRVHVPPDRASVTVEVVTTGKTLDAATSAHRERVERAGAALRDMENRGLKIERSTFRLSQNQPPIHPNAPQSKPEYQAATTFELTLSKLDAVDSTVTAIAATGLFEVRNIRFGIGERDAGLNAARKAAIDDARERATAYAAAAGVQMGSIVKIEDGGTGGPPELFAAAPAARSVGITPPETLTLSASVTVTWRITDKL